MNMPVHMMAKPIDAETVIGLEDSAQARLTSRHPVNAAFSARTGIAKIRPMTCFAKRPRSIGYHNGRRRKHMGAIDCLRSSRRDAADDTPVEISGKRGRAAASFGRAPNNLNAFVHWCQYVKFRAVVPQRRRREGRNRNACRRAS
jgi:hypothetical protein